MSSGRILWSERASTWLFSLLQYLWKKLAICAVPVLFSEINLAESVSQYGFLVSQLFSSACYILLFIVAHCKFRLLAGAPKAQTTQPGVKKGGGLFRCSTTSSVCQEMEVDIHGNSRALNGSSSIEIDSKSNQLFGATVVASRSTDGVLVRISIHKLCPSKIRIFLHEVICGLRRAASTTKHK